jgi:DNA ligase-1
MEVLTRLSNKEVVGHDAKDLVIQFLAGHGILDQESFKIREGREAEFELFGRLLDRNLIAGFGARTLSMVNWADAAEAPAKSTIIDKNASSASPKANPPTSAQENVDPSATQPPVRSAERRNLKSFPVALGKSIEPPFTEIAKSPCSWYASRKLDGVRVITFLDILVYHDAIPGIPLTILNANFYSRTGKPFTSLGKVTGQLEYLTGYSKLEDLLEFKSTYIGENDEGEIHRLVLDGEICVMREKQGEPSGRRPDDGTGAGAIWSDNNLEEDFTSTVSEIRRMAPYQISHPVYYIFDILPWTLFDSAKGSSKFSERVKDIRELGEWLAAQPHEEKILRPLAQWEIKDAPEIDGMVARAAEEGWEGLVLRADKPYKGSRS